MDPLTGPHWQFVRARAARWPLGRRQGWCSAGTRLAHRLAMNAHSLLRQAWVRDLLCAAFALALATAVEQWRSSFVCGGTLERTIHHDFATLEQSAEMFELIHGQAPLSVEELHREGIIAKVTRDRWGNSYRIHPRPDGLRPCIVSLGPDERPSEDDYSSCSAARDYRPIQPSTARRTLSGVRKM